MGLKTGTGRHKKRLNFGTQKNHGFHCTLLAGVIFSGLNRSQCALEFDVQSEPDESRWQLRVQLKEQVSFESSISFSVEPCNKHETRTIAATFVRPRFRCVFSDQKPTQKDAWVQKPQALEQHPKQARQQQAGAKE